MFYDIFYQYCKQKGVKPAQVARDLGISQSTVSMWKSQGTTPNAITFNNIAKYFDASIDDFIQDNESNSDVQKAKTVEYVINDIIKKNDNGDAKTVEEIVSKAFLLPQNSESKTDLYPEEPLVIFGVQGILNKLNSNGLRKVLDYIKDLEQLPQYRKDGDNNA